MRRRRGRSATPLARVVGALTAIGVLSLGGAVAPGPPDLSAAGSVQVTLSTADGRHRLSPQPALRLDASPGPASGPTVTVNARRVNQVIEGFGGSVTDSTADQLLRLRARDPGRYRQVMEQLFSTRTGLGLSMVRVPMTSSDFTAERSHWTDADRPGPPQDPLRHFGLHHAQTTRVIPVLRDALAINPELQVMASPWSAPRWMKTHPTLYGDADPGPGRRPTALRPGMEDAWAGYFVRWIRAFADRGVPVRSVTVQNEPYHPTPDYPGMTWTPTALGRFTSRHLVPALRDAGLRTTVVSHDHNWAQEQQARTELRDDGRSVEAVGWHCYGRERGAEAMSALHRARPRLPQYVTECSSDTAPGHLIGYGTAELVLRATQHWARGVLLWNLVLGPGGTPHLGGCNGCKGLLTVSPTGAAWTPLADQLGQVSQAVRPGAWHIASTEESGGIVTSAFVNRDGSQVLVAHNTSARTVTFRTRWNDRGAFDYRLPPGATVTFRTSAVHR